MYGCPDAPKSTPETRAMVEVEISKAGGDWDKAVKLLVDAGDKDAKKLPRNDWYRLGRRFEVLKVCQTRVSGISVEIELQIFLVKACAQSFY